VTGQPQTGATRGVADPREVEERAREVLATAWPGARLHDLQRLTGGASSLTYQALVDGGTADRVVVKMAPPGLDPVRNRDVLRQARVLQALEPVPTVRVPRVYATDAGAPPDVPPLFVMEWVDGESYEPLFSASDVPDAPPTATADDVDARVRHAVVMLAELQAHDPRRLGLADEPATTLEDEVGRWRKAFSSCDLAAQTSTLEQECHRRLLATAPTPLPPAILHGDWRLGNMQCVGGEVRGVIDWEIWSIGDPRVDLAWMAMMASPEHPSVRSHGAHMPSPQQHLGWYEEARGAAVPSFDWAQALVRYKQSAASALLVKNAAKRGESGEALDSMRDGITALLEWALTFLPTGREA
jgi:aminoglycoside phosphotransferase (APT) family kinase protein